jgi:hypothetical protein
MPNYKLGAKICRKKMKNGGACIYIQDELTFTINLQKHGKEQDLEIAAIQIRLNRVKLIIITIYRVPAGNLDYILNSLHKDNTEFIICGDINVNYLENNSKKAQLGNMFRTYNLTSTVHFPIRIINNSATLIDNIFIKSKRNYNVKQCVNGLSDHDAQLITIKNGTLIKGTQRSVNIREINKDTISEFQFLSSWEQWEDILVNVDVSNMFNNFLHTYLRCFHASFPEKMKRHNNNQSKWITNGIKISCKKKKELVLLCRHSNDINLKIYMKQYSKIPTKVIVVAKNYIIVGAHHMLFAHFGTHARKAVHFGRAWIGAEGCGDGP